MTYSMYAMVLVVAAFLIYSGFLVHMCDIEFLCPRHKNKIFTWKMHQFTWFHVVRAGEGLNIAFHFAYGKYSDLASHTNQKRNPKKLKYDDP